MRRRDRWLARALGSVLFAASLIAIVGSPGMAIASS
jgi:hypothetical protein